MTFHPAAPTRPRTRGRILAGLYLAFMACGIGATAFIADGFIVSGNARQTAANIAAHPALYRAGFSIFLVEMALQMAVTVLFYDLLRPVNRSLARMSAVAGLVGAGIKTLGRVFFYAPLLVLSGAPDLAGLSPEQQALLSSWMLKLDYQTSALALVFFGFESVLQGWLLFRSGFAPRVLGLLGMVAGLGWLSFLWPPLGQVLFLPVALLGIVGSLLTCGWLLVWGIDDERWWTRASRAAAWP